MSTEFRENYKIILQNSQKVFKKSNKIKIKMVEIFYNLMILSPTKFNQV
jgi:hypothetical protein